MTEKFRIPFPDPLGILSALTKDMPIELFDPLVAARQIREETPSAPPDEPGYVDDKIEKYKFHLEQALINSPCAGCKILVKSGLVAVNIYEEMVKSGKTREEFTDEEIEKIKKEVEEKYEDYA